MDKYLHHVCIQTNKYNESLRFYLNILGFQLEKETPNFHGRQYNKWMSLGKFMIEMQTPKYKDPFYEFNIENESITHICFYVEDIDDEYERIRKMGWDDFIRKNGKA